MNATVKLFLAMGLVWTVSVWGPVEATTSRTLSVVAGPVATPDRRVAVICCDPRNRGGPAAERPSLPIDPKVRASMQALEDCMVSLVGLKQEMRNAQMALAAASGKEASERRAVLEGSLQKQQDCLNQTIRLHNALFRTLSALFEELYRDVSGQ